MVRAGRASAAAGGYTVPVDALAHAMIPWSDNAATDWLRVRFTPEVIDQVIAETGVTSAERLVRRSNRVVVIFLQRMPEGSWKRFVEHLPEQTVAAAMALDPAAVEAVRALLR